MLAGAFFITKKSGNMCVGSYYVLATFEGTHMPLFAALCGYCFIIQCVFYTESDA